MPPAMSTVHIDGSTSYRCWGVIFCGLLSGPDYMRLRSTWSWFYEAVTLSGAERTTGVKIVRIALDILVVEYRCFGLSGSLAYVHHYSIGFRPDYPIC